MHELADDAANVALNQTHVVARSVAPTLSVYCNANVCDDPDPALGVTDTAATVATTNVALHAMGAFIVTMPSSQSASPPQLENVAPVGVGVSCTDVPAMYVSAHLPTQDELGGVSVSCAPL